MFCYGWVGCLGVGWFGFGLGFGFRGCWCFGLGFGVWWLLWFEFLVCVFLDSVVGWGVVWFWVVGGLLVILGGVG